MEGKTLRGEGVGKVGEGGKRVVEEVEVGKQVEEEPEEEELRGEPVSKLELPGGSERQGEPETQACCGAPRGHRGVDLEH